MANITLSIPDANLNRVLAGYANWRGWTAASGLTQAQFLRQDLVRWIKDNAKAGDVALQTAATDASATTAADTVTSGMTAT